MMQRDNERLYHELNRITYNTLAGNALLGDLFRTVTISYDDIRPWPMAVRRSRTSAGTRPTSATNPTRACSHRTGRMNTMCRPHGVCSSTMSANGSSTTNRQGVCDER